MPLRIVICGNHDQPFCTEEEFRWELENMGHQVIPVQENRSSTLDALSQIKDCDLVFYTHTHGWPVLDIFDQCQQMGIPTVTYHLDKFSTGAEKEREIGVLPYWKVKYFFTVDKVAERLMNSREDLPRAFYLPAGVVSRDCYLAQPDPQFAADVIFVGSRSYHTSWPYRPQLIDWLSNTYGDRFTLWGNDGKRYIREAALNQLYATAKVVVGDSLCMNFTEPDYFSDRPFETTGRGGFIIMPRVPGLPRLFK
jgi:hypothetical protein